MNTAKVLDEQQEQLNELIAEEKDLTLRLNQNRMFQDALKSDMWLLIHGASAHDTVIFPNGRRSRIVQTHPCIIVRPVTRTGKLTSQMIRLNPTELTGFTVQHNYRLSKQQKENATI